MIFIGVRIKYLIVSYQDIKYFDGFLYFHIFQNKLNQDYSEQSCNNDGDCQSSNEDCKPRAKNSKPKKKKTSGQ